SCEVEPIGTFTKYPELNSILHKVVHSQEPSIEAEITSSRTYRYTAELYVANPELRSLRPSGNEALVSTNTFAQFESVLLESHPEDGPSYVRILGLDGRERGYRWIRSEYITGPESFGAYKVVVPKASGSGAFGEVLSSPLVAGPQVAVTQTFITIGSFNDEAAAEACLRYVKSKFARALLGVLKITQDNPAKVWKYVPLQDFTNASEIDWSKSIPEIDQQLYAKYGLDPEEIAFIEANVKPME
ncbi:MAG: Eco57I restriction-modification methylase domain-containing protein, partial [Actinomycetota bacterium]